MRSLVIVAILAVVSAQEYHRDDNEGSFHFSTLKNQVSLGGLQTVQQVQPSIIQVQQQRPVQLLQSVRVQQPAVQVVRTVQTAAPAIQLVQQPQLLVQNSASLSSRANYATSYNAPRWRILEQVQEVDPSGPYRANFKTENGIQVAEQGALAAAGPEGPAIASQGSYSWTSPEGIPFTVSWIADESGYRAAGDHLPTPPPIPAEILRSLEDNAREGNLFDDRGFPLRQ